MCLAKTSLVPGLDQHRRVGVSNLVQPRDTQKPHDCKRSSPEQCRKLKVYRSRDVQLQLKGGIVRGGTQPVPWLQPHLSLPDFGKAHARTRGQAAYALVSKSLQCFL